MLMFLTDNQTKSQIGLIIVLGSSGFRIHSQSLWPFVIHPSLSQCMITGNGAHGEKCAGSFCQFMLGLALMSTLQMPILRTENAQKRSLQETGTSHAVPHQI